MYLTIGRRISYTRALKRSWLNNTQNVAFLFWSYFDYVMQKIPGSPRDTYSHSGRAWECGLLTTQVYLFCNLDTLVVIGVRRGVLLLLLTSVHANKLDCRNVLWPCHRKHSLTRQLVLIEQLGREFENLMGEETF